MKNSKKYFRMSSLQCVTSSGSGKMDIIADVQGKVVVEKSVGDKEELQIENTLKAGMYLIEVRNGREKIMQRFIVD